jgi:hypothetical protein
MTGGQPFPLLVLAGPCPRSAGDRPHTWRYGDQADLVSYGDPDHGLSVWLGRCQYCAVALLAVTPLDADCSDRAPRYEATGAKL